MQQQGKEWLEKGSKSALWQVPGSCCSQGLLQAGYSW
jgi:hypothetical protein